MKKLTKGQRFALAREARRLAMECVEGTAPRFGTNFYYLQGEPVCAIGHVMARSGIDQTRSWLVRRYLDDNMLDLRRAVTDANNGSGQRAALPFPLLALADALEASAASLPKAAPEVP